MSDYLKWVKRQFIQWWLKGGHSGWSHTEETRPTTLVDTVRLCRTLESLCPRYYSPHRSIPTYPSPLLHPCRMWQTIGLWRSLPITAGVMVGRWVIGNPWLFNQIRQALRGETITPVPLFEVRHYIERLWQTPYSATLPMWSRVGYLKMFLNYIAMFVDAQGDFLRRMRQTQTEVELLNLCDHVFLDDLTKHLALAPSLSL